MLLTFLEIFTKLSEPTYVSCREMLFHHVEVPCEFMEADPYALLMHGHTAYIIYAKY